MKGDVAAALAGVPRPVRCGRRPGVAVLTDLADFTHLVTRLKFVPDAGNDPSLSEIERSARRGVRRSAVGRVAVADLADAAQGHSETEAASRARSAPPKWC